ncbi:DUF2759 domain-containing protein [Sutcliffiella halmapala]|uniref:DUF2759 domain-containing protein n=1 Tax=Sutcliffiella tianshenii TaxID=1463404 RepID=A0ABS2NZS3_9BACI|nr:DUF2759 domain-containing protein [Bacillus tianshenii]MBM7620217.1 hypothetical protein [Bacillus tianshenii]MCA1318985.1 DUF2759 domain-containing protein [Bacillus tianshenii]
MPLVIIFGLVTILCLFAIVRSLREKNFLALLFALGTVVVFGAFTVATLITSGYPVAH